MINMSLGDDLLWRMMSERQGNEFLLPGTLGSQANLSRYFCENQ